MYLCIPIMNVSEYVSIHVSYEMCQDMFQTCRKPTGIDCVKPCPAAVRH